ncbi:MAG: amidohydrolase family protein [Planctomycetota bacterium]
MNDGPISLIQARAVRDAVGVRFDDGAAIAVQGGRILAVGRPADLPSPTEDTHDLGDALVTPAHVNAHAHLELSAIGSQPYPGDFIPWVTLLRQAAPPDDHGWFANAARDAAQASLDAGVGTIGDITSGLDVHHARQAAGLHGITFLELFGLAEPFDQPALARIPHVVAADDDTLGFQPHAPYSAGPRLFAAAAKSNRPVCTHLAELPEELRFVAHGDGPFRDFLQQLGKWNDASAAAYGQGLSPVAWMRPHLEQSPWLIAHGNYLTDDDIAILAGTQTSVAYCPFASAYFGHTDHRYRDLLAAGVNVCLGTDSIVCQPADEPQPLGLLPQMRFLHQRDGTDPDTLLAMATTHGATALGLPRNTAALTPGAPAAFCITPLVNNRMNDPLASVLNSDESATGMFINA